MIRWINQILGTAAYFEAVKDCVNEQDTFILDVREMVDKNGNEISIVKEKIMQGQAVLAEGRKLIVACDYGMSRSNAIACGILAMHQKVSIETAVLEVLNKTGERRIKTELLHTLYKIFPKTLPDEHADVFIAGGNGFLGRALTQNLKAAGISFIAPPRETLNLEKDAVVLDLMLRKYSPKVFIHLANPKVYTDISAMGTSIIMLKNILRTCADHRVKVIYPSGWEIYTGYRSAFMMVDENIAPYPKGAYGETKWIGEKLIFNAGRIEGLQFCILRFPPIYGRGSDRPKFIFNFINKARNNQKISTHQYTNGYPHLGLLNIEDAVKAIYYTIKNDLTGCYNIGSNQLYNTHEIASIIKDISGSSSVIDVVQIEDTFANIQLDYSKFHQKTGWEPKGKKELEEFFGNIIEDV